VFPYIAFRLLHTFSRSPDRTLASGESVRYVVYIIFFPALSAGPIDRIRAFVGFTSTSFPNQRGLGEAGKRLVMGLFKKFVIADTLGLVALNATNAMQFIHRAGRDLGSYAYAFRFILTSAVTRYLPSD